MNDPAHIESLGDNAAARGNGATALQHYEAALRLSPSIGRLHAKAAGAQLLLKNYDAAVMGFQRARALLPASLAVLNNLGCALDEAGRSAEAIAVLAEAAGLNPNYVPAPYNIGRIEEKRGRWAAARGAYMRVLALEPSHQQALVGLSHIARAEGNDNEAVHYLATALEYHPQSSDVHVSVAQLALRDGELSAGLDHARRAIALDPASIPALVTFGNIASKLGRGADADAAYQSALSIDPAQTSTWSAMLLSASYQSALTPQAVYDRHAAYGAMLEARVTPMTTRSVTWREGRRIRLGYVSSDFRRHACANFLLPLLQTHDRQKFEVVLYSNNLSDDDITPQFRALADLWRDIRHDNDDAAAQKIRDDEIDILIDCNGHTDGNRLPVFAFKPAPVAVTYLGLPITTGLLRIDYRLVDPTGSPHEDGNRFDSEQLVRLPNGYATYRPLCALPEIGRPPHLANGYITFGSFNNRAKLTRGALTLWARILNAVPRSRLLFKDRSYGDRAAVEDLITHFTAEGVDAARLVFRPQTDIFTNYTDYNDVDIALDPFPFNGYTTTCDALIMGVPVVSIMGDRYMARVTASVLTQLRLADLIARGHQDYVALAARLAADSTKLAQLRRELRDIFLKAPLGNPGLVVPDIERFYEAAVRRTDIPFMR